VVVAGPLRMEYEEAFCHIVSRGNGPRKVFFGKTGYEEFESHLKETRQKPGNLPDEGLDRNDE
jgi:hypothetical protein